MGIARALIDSPQGASGKPLPHRAPDAPATPRCLQLGARTLALLSLLLVSVGLGPAAAQDDEEARQKEIQDAQRRLQIWQTARDQVVAQHARRRTQEAISRKREVKEEREKIAKDAWETVSTAGGVLIEQGMAKFFRTGPLETQVDWMEKWGRTSHVSKKELVTLVEKLEGASVAQNLLAEVTKSPFKIGSIIWELKDQARKDPSKIDDALLAIEALNSMAKFAVPSKIAHDWIDGISSLSKGGLLVTKAAQANDWKAAADASARAATEFGKVGLLAGKTVLKENPLAKYAEVYVKAGELAIDLGYHGVATHLANRDDKLATVEEQRTLGKIDTMMKSLQSDLERLQGPHRPPGQEPGGIKLSNDLAEQLAFNIDLRSVHYDPVQGVLTLVGPTSQVSIDGEILVTALRLAVERHDPFFSLDCVRPADFDGSVEAASTRLAERYLKDSSGTRDLAADLLARGSGPVSFGGRSFYYAPLKALAPDLYADAMTVTDAFDPRMKLVISPPWLARTRVGEIMYRADVEIKAILTGLLDEDGDVLRAGVWDIPDFEPDWLSSHGGSAGRVDLELDEATVPQAGEGLDLSRVRPKLRKVHRARGTTEDLPPCPSCERVMKHFSNHWENYLREVPVFAELTGVFRSFVAAKLLVRKYPGLVQRILASTAEPDARVLPDYHWSEPVVWAAISGGRLEPFGEKSQSFFLGAGATGGIDLSVGARIRTEPGPSALDEWLAAGPPFRVGGKAVALEGDQVAFRLTFAQDHLGAGAQLFLWAGLLFGVLGAILAGRRIRSGRGEGALACAHCARVHGMTEPLGLACDAAAGASVLFVLLLPIAAAAYSDPGNMGALVGPALGVLSVVLAAGIAGAVGRRIFLTASAGAPAKEGMLTGFASGVRWLGVGLAIALLGRGFSQEAVGLRLVRLVGVERGERILAGLGGAAELGGAAAILLAAGVLAILVRWAIPPLAKSRPLLLSRPH